MTILKNIIVFAMYGLASTSGLVLLKMAVSERTINFRDIQSLFSMFFSVKFILGFTLYAIGFLTWLYILSKYKLSVVYPIASTLFFILVTLSSIVIFKEVITIKLVVGIIFCLAGIAIISWS